MNRPLGVGFVIDRLRPGAGTENQLILLLRRLDRSRVRPHLFCLVDDPELGALDLGDTPRVILKVPSLRRSLLPGAARLRDAIRRHRLALAVVFFRDASIVGTLGARWGGAAVIGNRRNLGYAHARGDRAIWRTINRFTHGIVANAEAVRAAVSALEGVDPVKITVIPNAVDGERYRPGNADRAVLGLPEEILIGCVANLRPVKGVDLLVEAFGRAFPGVPGVRLVLVGEGGEMEALRRRAAGLGVSDRVVFLGRRDDVPEILRALDVAILPSRSEGSSNAVLEYLASGLPVAAADVGGNRELLEDGELGILVPPEDVPALAGALRALVEDAGLRRRLAARGRRAVEGRYAVEPVVERWTRYLEAAAGR
jgi:glycosyltransferase involved in cell wall biosynthesis